MAIKCKPQGPRCKKFGFWTKVAKVSKPQRPFWLLTLKNMYAIIRLLGEFNTNDFLTQNLLPRS
ncbi:hypothetical protein Hanom_Chr17g01535481 [Helianthus anomalus]